MPGALRPRSARAAARRAAADPTIEAVYRRDDRRCLLEDRRASHGPCLGPLTPHHLRKAGQGGPWAYANLVTLCAGHNARVERHPDLYWGIGLVRRRGDTLAETWARLHACRLTRHARPPTVPGDLCPLLAHLGRTGHAPSPTETAEAAALPSRYARDARSRRAGEGTTLYVRDPF